MSAEIISLPSVTSDERRDIFEVDVDSPSSVRRSVLVVKGDAKLGNHYHRRLTEQFLLAVGEATLVTRNVDTDGNPFGEREVTTVTAPSLIVMPPFTAHLFVFNGPGVLICDSDQPFDKEDMISHPLS